MLREATVHCMGILKGLCRYEEDSESELKDWASDVPSEAFGDILRVWDKSMNKQEKEKMKVFITNEFPRWYSWAIKQL